MESPRRLSSRGIIGICLLLCCVLLPWGLGILVESTLAKAVRHSSPGYIRSVGSIEFSLWDRELTLHDVSIHALREKNVISASSFSGTLTWDMLWLALGIHKPAYDTHMPVLQQAVLKNCVLSSPHGEMRAARIETDAFGIWRDFFTAPEDSPLRVSSRIWWHMTLATMRMEGLRWHDSRFMGAQTLAVDSLQLQFWDNRNIDSLTLGGLTLAPRDSADNPTVGMKSLVLKNIHLPGESLLAQADKHGAAFSAAWITALCSGLLQGPYPLFERATAQDIFSAGAQDAKAWHARELTVAWPSSSPQRLNIQLGEVRLPTAALERISGLRFPALPELRMQAAFSSRADKDGNTRQQLTLTCPALADFTLETACASPTEPAGMPRLTAFSFSWQDRALAVYLVGNLGGSKQDITRYLQGLRLGRRSPREVLPALQKFLEHSGTMTLTLADGKAVTLDNVPALWKNPADIVDIAVKTGTDDVLRQARGLFPQ